MKPNKFLKILMTGALVLSTVCSSSIVDTVPSLSITSYAASEKLDAPKGFSYEADNTTITLSWKSVTGADAYRVYLYNAKTDSFETYKNVSKTKCVIKDLVKDTEYQIKVAALVKNGNKYAVQNKSKVILVTTKNIDIPNPPSKNFTGFATSNGNKYYYENGVAAISTTKVVDGKMYLFDSKGILLTGGIHTVNGNKYYSDQSGIVTCNDWITMKNDVYYYAKSSGKLTKYSIVSEGSYFTKYYLYINDSKITDDDLPHNGGSNFQSYYKIANNYYRIQCMANVEMYSESKYSLLYVGAPVFDIVTGKLLGNFYGTPTIDKTGYISSGKVYNSKDAKVYTFSGKNKAPTKSSSSPFIAAYKTVELNSVGGVDYTIAAYNNSNKTIKYVYYTVYAINRVNDMVKDDITNEYFIKLKETGPVEPNKIFGGTFKAIMYNYSANDIILSKVTIEYMDGTTKTLTGNQISYCY